MSNAIKYKGEMLAADGGIYSPGGTLYQYKELRADALEADSLELTVVSESGTIRNFAVNDPVEYYRDGRRRGTYYLRSVTRVGPKLYTLSALSAVGRLMEQPHAGGVYTGQLADTVIREICGDIPVIVETAYRPIQIYNWLPYADGESRSARDNLAEVLFVLGAYLSTDEDGVLRIEKLWDGLCSAIPAGRVDSRSANETTDQPVSAVTVTSHQYIPGTDETTLFEGTAEQGTKIIFDEPMHSLSADGLTILESGANYAVLAAGTGTLTGKTYIHNMRELTRTVTPGAAENVVAISDAKLVSLVNAADVALRMAEYYKHRTTLTVDVNPRGERAGHVVMIQHPWDGHLVPACIVSRETKVSGLLKSRTTALVDYTPPQPDASQQFTGRVLLTGSGHWTVPAGVTAYTAVLIDPGQGGSCGKPGSVSTATPETETTEQKKQIAFDRRKLTPAPGGEAGVPGQGGKVLVVTVTDAQPGTVLEYACGPGGLGAPYAEDSDTPGAYGSHTTLGAYSADSGVSSHDGYTDPVTGETFAAAGAPGVPGGDGVGYDKDGNLVTPDDIVVNGVHYTAGAQGESARIDFNGTQSMEFSGKGAGGLGGGPAYGANGHDGGPGSAVEVSSRALSVSSGSQGTGATALPPPKPTRYGTGGGAGNGGGGNGQTGWPTVAEVAPPLAIATLTATAAQSTGRGLGSDGGDGADGCIIIYFRSTKAVKSGWARDKNNKWRIDRLGRRCIV